MQHTHRTVSSSSHTEEEEEGEDELDEEEGEDEKDEEDKWLMFQKLFSQSSKYQADNRTKIPDKVVAPLSLP